MLARHMTIAEKCIYGQGTEKAGGFVDLARQEAETQRFLDHYGIKLKADTRLDRFDHCPAADGGNHTQCLSDQE